MTCRLPTPCSMRSACLPRCASRLSRAAEDRDLVEWRAEASALEIGGAERDLPGRPAGDARPRRGCRTDRGPVPAAAPACARMARLLELLDREGLRDAVLVDLGILRDWQYYSGLGDRGLCRRGGAAGRPGRPLRRPGRSLRDARAARWDSPSSSSSSTGRWRAHAGPGALDFGARAGRWARREPGPGGGAARRRYPGDRARVAAIARAEALAAAEGWRFVGHPEGPALRIVDRSRRRGAGQHGTAGGSVIAPLRICMPLGALYQDAIARPRGRRRRCRPAARRGAQAGLRGRRRDRSSSPPARATSRPTSRRAPRISASSVAT